MPVTKTPHEQLRAVAGKREVLTSAEMKAAGISGQSITRLVRAGGLERVQRGLYRLPDGPISEQHDLLSVMKVAPKAVIVLISALRFHEIGTQVAREVWIQMPIKAHVPRTSWPPLRIVRTSIPALLTAGVEIHEISGEDIPITCPERTVADCFKHRNQVGLDTCVEALREVIRSRRGSVSEIQRYAQLNRVDRVMRPFLEGMV